MVFRLNQPSQTNFQLLGHCGWTSTECCVDPLKPPRLPGLSHPAQESLQNLGHARQESPYVFGLNQVRLHRMILLWTPDYNRTSGSSALDFFAGFWSAANTIRGQADF